jgi:RNA polymerase sigma-54 factor
MPLTITLSPQLKVTAQTVLGSHLLRLAEAEVEEVITRELVDNPALERVGDDWYHTAFLVRREHQRADGHMLPLDETDDGGEMERIAAHESTFDQLIHQARLLVPGDDLAYVAYLIYCLNEHGFLTTPFDELAQELHISCDTLKRAIGWLQQLDPPGLGARDVHESLHLQCLALETRGFDCRRIQCILDHAWEPFTQQRWQLVAKAVGCTLSEIVAAVDFMRHHFHLFPLLLIPNRGEDLPILTRPDLIVRSSSHEGVERFVVEIPGADMTHLRISPFYERATHTRADPALGLPPSERAWVQQAVEQARIFIRGLEQRYMTLRQLGEYLVTRQADFFASGRCHLKPLTRAEVAHDLGLHPSTVSRAVSDKIVQLPDGRLIEMRELFDSSLAVKEVIRALLAASPEPLSDREIAERLHRQSFDVSRRTVTQYREELRIPRRSLRAQSQARGKGAV